MKPLVSVIVPVYNVEECLARCLDSLCKQSLINIEILLIDDASVDKSGEICDEFAEKDTRFKVIHNKTNKGLSVSRNTGIAHAIANYIMFVDSDDWVHKDFCKEAYECAVNYQADLVLFRFQRINKFGHNMRESGYSKKIIRSGYKTQFEAMEMLHAAAVTGVGQTVWNKLYRKELFEDIAYPPGYLCEDIGTTYRIVCKASCIYYLNKVLYYYCYRENSITTQKTEKFLNDLYELTMQKFYDLAIWGYPRDKLDIFYKKFAIYYCIKKRPNVLDTRYVFWANLLRSSKSVPAFFSWKQKVLFIIFKYCGPLFELICDVCGAKIC